MKRLVGLLLAMAMVLAFCSCAAQNDAATTPAAADPTPAADATADTTDALHFTAGTYTAETTGMHGPIAVEVTVDESSILDAKVTSTSETPGVGDYAGDMITQQIVETQSLDVDNVSGATVSSNVVRAAVAGLLEQAGGNMDKLNQKRTREDTKAAEYTADVVIIGGGGAGLNAAVAALEQGASVILVEKTDILGGNSLVVGGFINAVQPEYQDTYLPERSAAMESLITNALEEAPVSDEHKALQDAVRADYEAYLKTDKTMFDSVNWFALQTWNGGDKLGSLEVVKKLTAEAHGRIEWLMSNGMEFRDEITLGGGALYTRSRYAKLPNGLGYINAVKTAMEKVRGDNLMIMTSTEGVELTVEGDAVTGVIVKDLLSEKDITLKANKGVVLTTGGFAGNVDLRVKYCQGKKWPDLGPSLLTTNMKGVTGDGIFMAEAAGAALVNMDQIQLLPYCNPKTGQLNDTVGGGKVNIFINDEGKRFVREDGRRDDMSAAIIAQNNGTMWMFSNAAGYGVTDFHDAKTLGGQSVGYFLDNNLNGIVVGETLQDIADQLGFPVENLEQTLAEFNSHASEKTADEFGRVNYANTIEGGPYIAYPRKPAAHHTMGGVRIDVQTHALREDGSIVKGLYCAGEITGVVHGANRIGGNAIVDYLTFGREAGLQAAQGN